MSRLTVNSLPAERLRGCNFAETFESTALVQANQGTISSAPVFALGGTFDGIDDEVTYPTARSVKSVSFWIELGTTTEDVLNLSSAHSVTVSGGTISATGFTSPTIYVNGSATSTITTARSFVTITTDTAFDADDISVGYVASFGAFWISRLMFWSNALTAAEHAGYSDNSTYNYRNKALLDLPMLSANHDPGSVRTLDVSGNEYHAQFGDGSTPATYPTKLTTRGYGFDGGDYLVTNYIPGSSAITFVCLIDLQDVSTTNYIFSFTTQSLGFIQGILLSTATTFNFYAGGGFTANSGVFVHGGKKGMYFICGTADGVETKIYVNGFDAISAVTPLPLEIASNQFVMLGAKPVLLDTFFTGSYCCAEMYNFAFTPLQVIDSRIRLLSSLQQV